jgi:hypothetical protein
LAGIKGVLMKSIRLKGKGDIIEVRPSMIKLKSNDYGLEVIRCATFT